MGSESFIDIERIDEIIMRTPRSNTKKIKVYNPHNLPTVSYTELRDFQGDLKYITPENLNKLKASIIKHGIAVPKFAWKYSNSYFTIDGHQTIKALESLKSDGYSIPKIPIVEIQAKDKKEAAEILLKINSSYGTFNTDTSFFERFEFKELDVKELVELPMLDFEQIRFIDYYERELNDSDSDEVPEVDEKDVYVKTGDLYQLGNHRLLCGDATKKEDVDRLMDGKKADMVYCDPPYGMNLDTDYTKIRPDSVKSKEFAKEKGETTNKNYKPVIGDDKKWDFNNSNWFDCKEQFWWGAEYYRKTIPDEGSWFVWDKRTHDDGSNLDAMFGSCFELCWSKSKHKREIARIKYAGLFGTEREDVKKRIHPTQKPILLAEWFIEKYCKLGWLLVDLFLGSGSTLIACEKTNRKCYGMEIDPYYCQVIIERWEKFANRKVEKL